MKKITLINEAPPVPMVDESVDGAVIKGNHARDKNSLLWVYRRLVKHENPVFIDIGGHFGLFTMLAVLHSGVEVHAFEPNPLAMEILYDNVKLNNLEDRVFLEQVALFNEPINRYTTLRVPRKKVNWGLATLGNPQRDDFGYYDEYSVLAATLDFYEFERVDVIKIDVEGAELMVLEGAEETILTNRPNMIIEFNNNTRAFGYKPQAIYDLLVEWGANPIINGNELMVWWPELEEVPEESIHDLPEVVWDDDEEPGVDDDIPIPDNTLAELYEPKSIMIPPKTIESDDDDYNI